MIDNLEQENELFEGIKKSDWHCFIDKNASRYVDIFVKNEGKKVFISWNWAAFLFNIYWMFYRRMYKKAIFFMGLYSVLAILITPFISSFYMDELKPLYNELIEYEENYDPYDILINNSNSDIEEESGIIDLYNIEKKIEFIMNKITLWTVFFLVLSYIPLGLFADCIYKDHIHKNIEHSEGGISYRGLIIGYLIYYICTTIIISPIAGIVVESFVKLSIK